MFRLCLVDEVKGLLARKLSSTGARIIGIPEVEGSLAGEYDVARARELIKLHTRHYIKRQMTWFRKDKRVKWLMVGPCETPDMTAQRVQRML
jgi:tRNA dimethylallyltransferase